MVSISVVIAAKNRPLDVQRLLESLRVQSLPPTEIVLVDDGSEPPLPSFPCSLQLRNDVSQGACHARNLGFSRVSGKYVFIFDDDAELTDRALVERAVKTAEDLPRLGAVAFQQLMPTGEIHWMQPASGGVLRLVPTFFGFGAMLPREPFEAVGGFFEPLGYYCEENELSLRLIDSGFTIVYDPSLQVVHHEHKEGRDNRAIHRLGWRNNMYTIVARYPIFLVLPGLARATIRWIRLARDWRHFRFRDLIWGWGSVWNNLPDLVSRRQPVKLKTLRQIRHLARAVVSPRRLFVSPDPSSGIS